MHSAGTHHQHPAPLQNPTDPCSVDDPSVGGISLQGDIHYSISTTRMKYVLGCAAATATLLLLVRVQSTQAFAASRLVARPNAGAQTTTTTTTTTAIRMAPLSNEEIFARAQQAQKQREQDAEPQPMLFDEDMLVDMQAALLLMEERVTGGPGALSLRQVDQLEAHLNKIRKEMKENEHKRPPRPVTQQPAPPVSASAPSSEQRPPPPPRVATADSAPLVIDIDTPSDEGKAYDGRGGMGQAADTTNTYIIPGMDEMTAEEYQKALQASIIARQQKRKGSVATGNRASWNYLNSLTGETGVLKKEVSEDDDNGAAEDNGSNKKSFSPFKKPNN